MPGIDFPFTRSLAQTLPVLAQKVLTPLLNESPFKRGKLSISIFNKYHLPPKGRRFYIFISRETKVLGHGPPFDINIY